jgi:hypothetical protein
MRSTIRIRLTAVSIVILPLGLVALAGSAQTADPTAQQAALLLGTRCITCHNSVKKAGGIDLSSRSSAIAAKAVGTGAADQTRLVRAVTEGRMPPTGKLPKADVDLLRHWVATGAAYLRERLEPIYPHEQPLWSFQPLRQVSPPKTRFDSLSNNPIDHFVFGGLAKTGLKPSPPANRLALLRRITVDLTGLPPTPEEVDAFLADKSANAYEKVVDRLLASPAYGERWGRHWLDVVRYGESSGYEQNHIRPNAWPYRDYVIRSFNEDKPYDRFVTEQLAGDALAKESPDANVATGFLVAGIHDTVGIQTEEGTRQQRSNDLEDIVSTTGAAFLGLTVGCAKCHDHKFDPIPQRDFYRFAACFAGVRHGERALQKPTDQQVAEAAEVEKQIAAKTNEINALDSQARAIVLAGRGAVAPSRPPVSARHNVDSFEPVEARFVRLTVLATRDGTEPCLDELQVFRPGSTDNLALAASGAKATASSLLQGFAIHKVEHLNDGKFGNEWSWISGTRGTGWAQIELPKAVRINQVVWSRDGAEIPRFDDRLAVAYRIETSLDGKVWVTVTTEAGRAGSNDYVHPDELQKSLTAEQREQRKALTAELGALKKQAERLRAQSMAYIGQFSEPDTVYLLRRGDVMQRGDPVVPGALSQLNFLRSDLLTDASKPEPERRLALALWICDPKNPLTTRVIVNRIWQYHFGRGIVGTPSDFGRNGEKPTHPQLLDWLAHDFMANGWRMKRLHKMMVMSYTYRQSSNANAAGTAKDAGNLLLWRMPLRRMEAESIRDAILATSGKLDRRMGGPSFRLYKYRVVNVAIYEPTEEFGPETWRRSVYQQAARGIRDDLLGTFDCPESSQRAPKRDSTTTALQALSLLNGPFMQQQAGFLAERVRKEAGEQPRAQLERAFRLAFGRVPRAAEAAAALNLIGQQDLTALCRALMNANEFLYY